VGRRPADSPLTTLTDQLNAILRQAVFALAQEELPARWEVPNNAAVGDLSSPVAFRIAARWHRPPTHVAGELVAALQQALHSSPLREAVQRIDAQAGFVNLTLSQQTLTQMVAQILGEGPRYGTSTLGQGTSVLIECVSANPTGPLSVAHGRQAAMGDALARLLRSQGARVVTEYYVNDEGRQIDLLGQSLRARYLQQLGESAAIPEGGYQGAYLVESAARLKQAHQASLIAQPMEWFVQTGVQEQLQGIQEDLTRFGLVFDRWTSQRDIRLSGAIDRALEALRAKGYLYEHEGAVWFASTKFGDDKDRVVRKQSGELTYLAPDIAYHQLKFQEGFDRLINLWGPDHHGYIPRIKASALALGLPAERLTVRIVQLVTLSRLGKVVPMSKREGEFVTFREILDEVGVDATRFFYLMRTMDSHLDFDLELATSQSQDNPVYYIQYAHARICSILARDRAGTLLAGEEVPRAGKRAASEKGTAFDGARLVEPEERLVLRQLFQFPVMVSLAAQALEAHGITVYLQKLAELFHAFYTKQRVITEDAALTRARLALAQAARIVLANGLQLLGVSAPERMEHKQSVL